MEDGDLAKVYYDANMDLAFCEHCTTYLRITKDSVKKHLRAASHSLAGHTPGATEKRISDARSRLQKTDIPTITSRNQYLKYYEKDSGSATQVETGWDEYLPKIPILKVVKAFRCTKCFYVSSSDRKAKQHDTICACGYIEVDAQTLFSGSSTRYFPIHTEVEEGSWLEKAFSNTDRDLPSHDTPADDSDLNAFISTLNVQRHLSRNFFTTTMAYDVCQWKGTREDSKSLFNLMRNYIQAAQDLYDDNMFIQTHSLAGSQIHLHLEQSTVERYIRHVLPLLYFLTNMFTEGSKFLEVLESNNRLRSERFQDIKRHLTPLLDNSVPDEENFTALHNILKSLFLFSGDRSFCLVAFFISCSTVWGPNSTAQQENLNLRFKNGSEVSPLLAALLFLIQCMMVHEIYGNLDSTKNNTSTDNNNKNDLDERPVSNCTSWKNMSSTLTDGDAPVTYIKHCLGVCRDIRESEIAHVRFIVCRNHSRCAILDGMELSLSTLGSVVKTVQQDLHRQLHEDLMFSFGPGLGEAFWSTVQAWGDNFQENRVGYWFGRHPRNVDSCDEWRRKFTAHLYSVGFATETGKFKMDETKTFLKGYESFTRRLFWLLNVVSGGPARTTELASIRFRNSTHGPRNIYLQRGRLMTVIFYHKGRGKFGGVSKPIARFPDKVTSDLCLLYLIFVKPLESIIVDKMGFDQSLSISMSNRDLFDPNSETDYLFTSRKSRIGCYMLRTTFQETMAKTGCTMTSRQYRQYHTGAMNHLLNSTDREVIDSLSFVSDTIHLQAGHSTHTANHTYGVSEVNMRMLDGSSLETFRRSSDVWHAHLGILGAAEDEALEHPRSGNSLKPDIDPQLSTASRLQNLESKLDGLISLFTDPSHSAHNRPNMKRSRGASGVDKPHLGTENEVLTTMRTILKDHDGNYRSSEQRLCLLHVCQTQTDALFILPTGAGKSMLYFVPAILSTDKIILLIVPLVALQQDIMRRCSEIGIQTGFWDDRNAAGVKVVLCSCEHVVTDDYRSFVQEQHNRNRLLSIYIEEIHLLAQWSGFRPVLGRLKQYLRAECNVPIYGMTATCPPALQSQLSNLAGMGTPVVIRQSGTRQNISYNVMKTMSSGSYVLSIANLILGEQCKTNSGMDDQGGHYIIYCNTRVECENYNRNLGCVLAEFGIYKYHAGMPKAERTQQSKKWMHLDPDSKGSIMLATSAFGCGIDMPNVKMVIHVGMPRTIMGFLQESGRAGRSGQPSRSVVLLSDTEPQPMTTSNGQTSDMIRDDGLDELSTSDELCYEHWGTLNHVQQKFGKLDKWANMIKGECRRWILDGYNDNERSRKTCSDRELELCDLCRSTSSEQSSQFRIADMLTTQNFQTQYGSDGAHRGNAMNPVQQASPPGSTEYSQRNSDKNQTDAEVQMTTQGYDPYRGSSIPITNTNNRFEPSQPACIPITPEPVRRRLNFDDGRVTQQPITPTTSSTPSYLDSQSKTRCVTPIRYVREMAASMDSLCAVCSVERRRKVSHSGRKQDDQKCSSYSRHCLKCGSKYHNLSDCHTSSFRHRQGWCYSCSLQTHRRELLHNSGTYGNKNCHNRNVIRMVVVLFQHEVLRQKLLDEYTELSNLQKDDIEGLVNWLRSSDNDENTVFANVTAFIAEKIIA